MRPLDRLPVIGDRIIVFSMTREGGRPATVAHMQEVKNSNSALGLTDQDIEEPYIDHNIRGFIYDDTGLGDIAIMQFRDGFNKNIFFEA